MSGLFEDANAADLRLLADGTREVPITVFGDPQGTWATVPHNADLPHPFNDRLQVWAGEHFDLANGETIEEAGVLEYVPNGRLVDLRLTETDA